MARSAISACSTFIVKTDFWGIPDIRGAMVIRVIMHLGVLLVDGRVTKVIRVSMYLIIRLVGGRGQ